MTKKFHIECFSKGLYSNWFWHTPSRTLFDIGEGFATYAGNFVFGVERICISHAAHGDHIAGLAAFIGIRNASRGDKLKPLDIYYPFDNEAIEDYKTFIKARMGSWLTFKVNWNPIAPGHVIALDKTHEIRCFPMRHLKYATTLGYKIVEKRSRLKAEFIGRNIPELINSGVDKNSLNEAYEANMIAYCLDACDFHYGEISGAELAIMDCSFLRKEDRDEMTHFTLDESITLCREAKVKCMAIAHISSRYNPMQINDATSTLDKEKYVVINPNQVNTI